ncbi:MAG TPA: DUF5655 domain-containing protein [Euzebyales bacterium]|nr:DUF5655 domain-containing protein [Euzebyales bacterium]
MTPDDYFGECRLGIEVFAAVSEILRPRPVEVRTTKSQVAFRTRRGFAYVWMPGRYLSNPGAQVVLSIALDRRLGSERFKEVAHPSTRIWQHHLEIHEVTDIDDEVARWLLEAYERAG